MVDDGRKEVGRGGVGGKEKECGECRGSGDERERDRQRDICYAVDKKKKAQDLRALPPSPSSTTAGPLPLSFPPLQPSTPCQPASQPLSSSYIKSMLSGVHISQAYRTHERPPWWCCRRLLLPPTSLSNVLMALHCSSYFLFLPFVFSCPLSLPAHGPVSLFMTSLYSSLSSRMHTYIYIRVYTIRIHIFFFSCSRLLHASVTFFDFAAVSTGTLYFTPVL